MGLTTNGNPSMGAYSMLGPVQEEEGNNGDDDYEKEEDARTMIMAHYYKNGI